jgi:hypothetical protein
MGRWAQRTWYAMAAPELNETGACVACVVRRRNGHFKNKWKKTFFFNSLLWRPRVAEGERVLAGDQDWMRCKNSTPT